MTEEQIEELLSEILSRIEKVNNEYLELVGKQIAKIGKLNPSSIHKLQQMQIYGANSTRIKRELAKALNISQDEVEKLLEKAVEEEYTSESFREIVSGIQTELIKNPQLTRYVEAVARQTAETMLNFSNTTNIDDAYKEVVSDAIDAVYRGVTDYNSAIRSSLRKMGGDGLRVTYESGHTRRMDTAIRQNILDGVRQVQQKANEMLGEEIGADGVELSAHPYSALDHEPAQGRQYSLAEFAKMQSGESFSDYEGNSYAGFKRPIGQWNCHHITSYIILGVSSRRYTDEQLKQWKEANHKGCEIDGQHYTTYQASQLMRKLETKVRQQKDIANLAKISGDDVLRREAQAKIRDLKKKYSEVAEASGLRERRDKMVVASYKNIIDSSKNNGIIQTGASSGAVSGAAKTAEEKDLHAERFYEEIRKRKPFSDANKIYSNTNQYFSVQEIEDIRQHMFIKEQPRNGGMFRFDADYHQALAWQRLVEGSGIKDTDILMLQHELCELSLMRKYGYTYEIAHEMTNEVYNWQKAIIEEASK